MMVRSENMVKSARRRVFQFSAPVLGLALIPRNVNKWRIN